MISEKKDIIKLPLTGVCFLLLIFLGMFKSDDVSLFYNALWDEANPKIGLTGRLVY